ncbi:MAG: CPBP family intramembrane metalloprotease [Oscillospiraceae bacterium]
MEDTHTGTPTGEPTGSLPAATGAEPTAPKPTSAEVAPDDLFAQMEAEQTAARLAREKARTLSPADYTIDVARESSYQNQDSGYHRSFLEWRSRKENRYAYRFVHDKREHAYIDGQGYVQASPGDAEKTALVRCAGLLGTSLLVMLIIQFLESALAYTLLTRGGTTIFYSSHIGENQFVPVSTALLIAFLHILRYIVPALIFLRATKIPLKVVIPDNRIGAKVTAAGLMFMLMAYVSAKIVNQVVTELFGTIKINLNFSEFMFADNFSATVIFAVCDLIVCAVLSELFFRGIVMQTFRQFGDTFALLASSVVFTLAAGDIALMGNAAVYSVVIGLFTLRTGSVRIAVGMRIFVNLIAFAMTVCKNNLSQADYRLMMTVFCAAALAVSMIVLTRFIRSGWCDFGVDDNTTTLETGGKLGHFLSSAMLSVWLVFIIITAILNIRFLN